MQILQDQNKQQQDQILELAHFLIQTLVQVGDHQEALCELNTRLLNLNKSLMSTMQAVFYLKYTVTVLADVCIDVTHLTSGILSLKENVDALYEYLRILASHKVNPLMVPPVDLFNILVKVKHDMKTNPRHELLDDPNNNISAYVSFK